MSTETALPMGTVTMLFTDIEGSTRLLKQLGHRYGDLLADHHRLLREAFTARGGQEIGTPQGDALFVAFTRGRDAVEAAVEAQRGLAEHEWPDGVDCRVRMGLHTGELSIGEVGYHGMGLHRCARIASAAHGGQVLLSSVTAELVQDDLPSGISLLGLGERRLKDIDRPERLYQLVAGGLLSDFPQPRTEAAPKVPAARTRARRPGPVLIGRDDECRQLDELLEDARASRSRTLAIRGEAGVGKSSLLAYAVDRADDFLVLRAVGFESEAELAFSGLLQLCRPLLDRLNELPAHQSRALGAALGLAPADEADRLTIGVATLALLALAAEETDVLLAVDDAQWIDSASIDAILFAARRFEADQVAVILTVREDGTDFATTGVDELRLEGLAQDAARLLLAAHSSVALAPGVADRLHELTNGNPLALVELPRVLSEAQLDGAEPFEQPLHVGTRVERAFRGRVEALSPEAQRALLIASASESDRLDTIVAALEEDGLDSSALLEAEDIGLISLADQSLLFRHPLARSAVYHSAAPSGRRAAHAALASALTDPRDVERRAWQLASASFGPDEEVATALEEAADTARERSGYSGASAAYERAARLSPSGEGRLRRLLAAGEAAWNAGQTTRAIALLDEALADCGDPALRGRLLNVRGHIERHTAHPSGAYEMLMEAGTLLDDVSPLDAAAARIGAWRAAWLLGDRERRLGVAQLLSDRAERDGGFQEFCASLALGVELDTTSREESRRLLDRADSLVEERGGEVFAPVPRLVSLAGMATEALDQPERGLAITGWAVDWARENGIYGALPVALLRKFGFQKDLGQFSAAYATVSEAAAIAAQQGTLHFLRSALLELAWFEAVRGQEDMCRGHVEEARETGKELGVIDRTERVTLGLLELGLGRLATATDLFQSLVFEPPLGSPGFDASGEPTLRVYIPDLVEAYVRSGRGPEAERLLGPLSEHADQEGPSFMRALAARCRGLVAADESFEQHFVDALAEHSRARTGFLEARTRLCFGERLRRARRRRDARDQLRPALDVFEAMGANPWVERAQAELRATGERLRARDPAHEELTAQELRIALQAAEGKTNRQIGATMFLSPKTVEFHLGRAYRKLGIASRAELIRHFATGAGVPPLSAAAND